MRRQPSAGHYQRPEMAISMKRDVVSRWRCLCCKIVKESRDPKHPAFWLMKEKSFRGKKKRKAKPPKMVTPTRCADKAENIALLPGCAYERRSRETRFEEEKREKHTIWMICGGQKDFVLIPLRREILRSQTLENENVFDCEFQGRLRHFRLRGIVLGF